MQITKIRLNSYLHFQKDLEIDLTYPKGHAKSGKPLEKVCFLGQSATGKTALLNLIRCCVCEGNEFDLTGIDKSTWVKDGVEFFYTLDGKKYSKRSAGDLQFEHYDYTSKKPKKIEYVESHKTTIEHLLRACEPLLISFPFCVVTSELSRKVAAFSPKTGELRDISPVDRRITPRFGSIPQHLQ